MKKNCVLGFIGCGLLLLISSASGAARFDEFNCRTGIVYKTVNGEALDMAIFLPSVKKHGRAPVVVYIHGGGWGAGDKTRIFNPPQFETLQRLLDNGIACVAIEYRLTRNHISTAYDCVVDCKDAARFLVKHAGEFGLDPQRMGTWGGSAGGHLCLMTGLAPDNVFPGVPELKGVVPDFRCVASLYPATTFLVPEVMAGSGFANPARFISFLGGPYDENMALAKMLSPVEYLSPASPPVLLVHGDKDQILPYRNSTYMMEVAEKNGADVTLLTVTNGLHSFGGPDIHPSMSEINRMVADFIIEKLTEH